MLIDDFQSVMGEKNAWQMRETFAFVWYAARQKSEFGIESVFCSQMPNILFATLFVLTIMRQILRGHRFILNISIDSIPNFSPISASRSMNGSQSTKFSPTRHVIKVRECSHTI